MGHIRGIYLYTYTPILGFTCMDQSCLYYIHIVAKQTYRIYINKPSIYIYILCGMFSIDIHWRYIVKEFIDRPNHAKLGIAATQHEAFSDQNTSGDSKELRMCTRTWRLPGRFIAVTMTHLSLICTYETLFYSQLNIWPWVKTYGTIFKWMNIYLPAIFMFTRGTGFWPMAICLNSGWSMGDREATAWRHDIHWHHGMSSYLVKEIFP